MNQPSVLLVRGGLHLPVTPPFQPATVDVLIEGERIAAIAPEIPIPPDAKVLSAHGRWLLPGFVQSHVHLVQTLFRGVSDDAPLLDWLQQAIWPLEAAHDPDSVRASVGLGVAELLLGGTTAVLTMETVHHTETVLETLAELPLHAIVGKCLMDLPDASPTGLYQSTDEGLREASDLVERWGGAHSGRLGVAFAPRFALSCSEALHREVAREASARGTLVHTHASEHRSETSAVERRWGRRNMLLLDDFGLTKTRLRVAHAVWLDEREIAVLRDRHTHVLHCPTANLKLGSGIAPIVELRRAGIPVSLGADGAGCNNRLCALTEMRTAALLQKMRAGPEALTAREVLAMATIEGARALGREADLGSIEVGKRAHLVLVDPSAPHLCPSPDPYGGVVYAATSKDITTVVVDGEIVVDHGRVVAFDADEARENAVIEAEHLYRRAGLCR